MKLDVPYIQENYPKTYNAINSQVQDKSVVGEIEKHHLAYDDYYAGDNGEDLKNILQGQFSWLKDNNYTLPEFLKTYVYRVLPVDNKGGVNSTQVIFDSSINKFQVKPFVDGIIGLASQVTWDLNKGSYMYDFVNVDDLMSQLITNGIIKVILFNNDGPDSDTARKNALLLYIDYSFSLSIDTVKGILSQLSKEVATNNPKADFSWFTPMLVSKVLHDSKLASQYKSDEFLFRNTETVLGTRINDLYLYIGYLEALVRIIGALHLPSAHLEKHW